MENYRKASTEEEPSPCPFPDLPPGTPLVHVKDGSKIRNILGFALSRVEASHGDAAEPREAAGPLSRQIVFTATGKGISKAITCTEMVKRRLRGGAHQHTVLHYRALRELWEPLEPAAGLDALTVSRNVPAVWILLSRDPLDPAGPGYQAPGDSDGLWAQTAPEEGGGEGGVGGRGGQRSGARRKRGGFGERGGGGRGRGGSGRPSGRSRGPVRGHSHS